MEEKTAHSSGKKTVIKTPALAMSKIVYMLISLPDYAHTSHPRTHAHTHAHTHTCAHTHAHTHALTRACIDTRARAPLAHIINHSTPDTDTVMNRHRQPIDLVSRENTSATCINCSCSFHFDFEEVQIDEAKVCVCVRACMRTWRVFVCLSVCLSVFYVLITFESP